MENVDRQNRAVLSEGQALPPNGQTQDVSFIPANRRPNSGAAAPKAPPPSSPRSSSARQSAMRFADMVEDALASRDDAQDKLNRAEARIEQFQSNETDLRNQIAELRLQVEAARNQAKEEVAAANRRTDSERQMRLYLLSAFTSVESIVANVMTVSAPPQQTGDEQEETEGRDG